MSRRVVAIAAVAVVAAISGLAVWNMPARQAAVQQPAPAPVASAAPERLIEAKSQPARPATPGQLRFRRVEAETGGEAAEACLVFDAELPDSGVRWDEYAVVKGGAKVTYRTDAKKRLCLGGLGFGIDYVVSLRAGLPAADGGKLAETVEVPVGFGDRRASVSFGSGLILPRESGDSVPVTTVNAARLDVRVMRVGDRMVARMRQGFAEERSLYTYQVNEIRDDDGHLVWNGKVDIAGPRNEAVVSQIPVGELVRGQPPGIFLITASLPKNAVAESDDDDEYSYGTTAGQWIVHSDIGLTAFSGDGLTVFARSLASAKPMAGLDLVLVARNNEELARVKTDASGRAAFDPGLMRGQGGMAPVMVMAYARGDYNFLDLRRSEFDLSDRGVDGRPPSGPVDAFLYTERGIYRPGETVELVALLRDPEVRALGGRPAVVKVMRPDGREFKRWRLEDKGGGALHVSVALPAAANRGMWQATAHADPEGPVIGKVAFDVQDFVPQRLGLTIGERPASLRPKAELSIPVEARFLYGAPASELGGEAELVYAPDPAPYPAYKGFRWGLHDERFNPGDRVPLDIPATDAQGRTVVTGRLGDIPASSLPLRAEISIAIREPGGRTTGEHFTVPVRSRALDIGVRPHFADSVREGTDATFDVIAVDDDGNRSTQNLAWRITREDYSWQWYRRGTEWRYEAVTREREVAAGTVATSIGEPAVLRQRVGWGRYKLTVTDPVTRIATTVPFYAGWYGGQSADRPDRLVVAADRPGYAAGETARLNVEAEADGEALLVVANERVHETRVFRVSKGGNEVSVPVKPEWGPGAYALVTVYRPLDARLGHAPVRSVGVAWLGLDPARRTLAVEIGGPQKVGPRGRVDIPVKVAATGGTLDKAHVTLAAVDQGILQLTRFQTPNPAAHYLS
ncbi:MAG TPA: MG2 domain-containing protein, partial [Candidatus Omnitrophota bacterium]|nr:MG2 domain-containing protein [Candidatus Omnitrophota bacterium]